MITARRAGHGRKRRLPAAIAAAAALLLVALLPTASTGAYWTTAVAGSQGTAGMAQWCTTPDPAVAGAQYIRLSSITTGVTNNRRMAIVPVANNAAWGGGTGTKTLSVRLFGCQTDPPDSLRVTSWSNPVNSSTMNRTWLAGSTVAPASRLDPNTTGLGTQLRDLAHLSAATATVLIGASGEAQRYSWIIANGRTSSNLTADPAVCDVLLGLIGGCVFPITNGSGVDSTFKEVFDITPWDTTGESVSYGARSYAKQTPTGWGSSGASINCVAYGLGLSCRSTAAATTLAAAGSTDLFATIDGNKLQWLVIEWTGTTAPTSDLVLQIVLT